MRLRPNALIHGLLALAATAPPCLAADPPLADYFRAEVAKIDARPFGGIGTGDAWKAARPETQRRLRAMLGLDPLPDRTPLEARIVGVVERDDVVIERLLYQSSPGLYVTANLYRPREVDKPLPAILYVCGHAIVEKDGVVHGAKAHYQHHAAWYARNGYVCLVLDTLQLGELPGLHHGTNKFGMWWWPSRGYTPAGIEAWNAIRGLDYLTSRPEVDKAKIGMTGRSGGGATTWFTAAIDDRVAVVVPVAGITDLKNHVVDGVVEGHCDCMFHVNTARWDFDVIAALIAPRPMLVVNTDKDPIFPEDGVRRLFKRAETAYDWYGACDRLQIVIGKGGHADTPEIRHPSFVFMDHWLKGVDRAIVEPDRNVPGDQLAVLRGGAPPEDNANPTIHERFRRPASLPPVPADPAAWDARRKAILARVEAETFAGWPSPGEASKPEARAIGEASRPPVKIKAYEYDSQAGITPRFWTIERLDAPASSASTRVRVRVISEESWKSTWSAIVGPTTGAIAAGTGTPGWIEERDQILRGGTLVLLAPRGIGPTAWPVEKDKHVRRRFLLLGQTLDGMRAWDVRRGIDAWRSVAAASSGSKPTFLADGEATTWLLWALATRPDLEGPVVLADPPTSVDRGPSYLNLASILDMPEAIDLLYPRPVRLRSTPPSAWRWTADLGAVLGRRGWPEID